MEILITILATVLVSGAAAFLVSRSMADRLKKRYEHLLADKDIAQQQALETKEQACRHALESKDLIHEQALDAKEQALQAQQKAFENTLRLKEEAHRQLMDQQKEKYEETLKTKDETYRQLLDEKQSKFDQTLKAKDEAHEKLMSQLQAKLEEQMQKMSAQLKNDTSEILKARQEELQKSSSESLGQIVNPLKDNLKELKKALEDGNKEIAERNGEMRARIKGLMEQTDATRKSADELANALLHKSKMQGDWGEIVLTELLESQGLTEGIHFHLQDTIRDAQGRAVKSEDGKIMRPDVVLHVDETREIIIDSKVSLTAYTDYVNAENETDRETALQKHISSLKAHVEELARKDYSSHIKAPKQSIGYVIMFVPITAALWTALNRDRTLWRTAADKNVYICDEQSLYGALRVVSLTWTNIAQVQNQKKVYDLAQTMLDRVGQFLKAFNTIGDKLNDAQKAFDDGSKKLQDGGQSICKTARQLIDLGVRSEKAEIKALSE